MDDRICIVLSYTSVMNLLLFNVPRILSLDTTFFFIFGESTSSKINFYMKLYRLQRQSKSKTIWKEKNVSFIVRDLKIIKRTDRTEQKTVFKPVVSRPLLETFKFDVNQLSNLSVYKSSLELRFEPSKSLLKGLSELDTF